MSTLRPPVFGFINLPGRYCRVRALGDPQTPRTLRKMIFLFGCLILGVTFLLGQPLPSNAEQNTHVLVLKSGTAAFYDEVVELVKQQVELACASDERKCPNIQFQSYISNETKPVYQQYDLVITLGMKARDYARRHLPQVPMINAMLPHAPKQETQPRNGPLNPQLILLEQPIERSLRLIQGLLPSARAIGLLSRPGEDTKLLHQLTESASRAGLTIVVELVPDMNEIGKSLSRLMDQIDVLLAQPDIAIYNRNTVSRILLSSYRKKIPVIGYSAACVKAGALAAVYSAPRDIARDIGEHILYFMDHRKLSRSSIHPDHFSVSLNHQVGSSLGIQITQNPEEVVGHIREYEQ